MSDTKSTPSPVPVNRGRITGLGDLITAAQSRKQAPVEQWDPPYCGDIGMKIRANGQWIYNGSPINRPRLVKLFSTILRHDNDGRHYLVTPVEKVDVEIEDAPFLAVELDVDGHDREQVLTFRTNVDDIVTIDADHPLTFQIEQKSQGLKPYVRVRGRLQALVTRALYYDLVELAVPREAESGAASDDTNLGIWSKGTWFPLGAGKPEA